MRKFITSIFLLTVLLAIAAKPQYLTVHTNGQIVPYPIEHIKKITFSGKSSNTFEIHNQTGSVDIYRYYEVDNVTFDADPSGVENVKTANNDLTIVYNTYLQEISITSSNVITAVMICDIKGTIYEASAPMSDKTTITISDYEKGLYVVKAITASATQTKKILKY